MHQKSRPYQFSLAGRILAEAGVQQLDIARQLGCSPATVCLQLAGRQRCDPRLIEAIRKLADDRVADQVAALLMPTNSAVTMVARAAPMLDPVALAAVARLVRDALQNEGAAG